MLILYLFQKYLDKKDEYKFLNIWETKILNHTRRWFLALSIYYTVAISLITYLITFGEVFILFVIIIFVFVAMIYGYYFLKALLKFIAINNQRYFEIKMNGPQADFSKDNVIN